MRNIGEGKKNKLNAAGIITVRHLVDYNIEKIVPGISKKAMVTFKHQANEAKSGSYIDVTVDHRMGTILLDNYYILK